MASQDENLDRLGVPIFLTVSPKVPTWGETVTVALSSSQPVHYRIDLRFDAVTYTGDKLFTVGNERGRWDGSGPFTVTLAPDVYGEMLNRTEYLDIVAYAYPALSEHSVHKATWTATKSLRLRAPKPSLKLVHHGSGEDLALTEEPLYVGDTVDVEVEWRNPLPSELTECEMAVDDSAVGDLNGKTQPLENVPIGGTIRAHAKVGVSIAQAGETRIVAGLSCAEFEEAVVQGFATVVAHARAGAEVSDKASVTDEES